MARLTNETREGGRPQEEAGASARVESQRRFARLRERWRNASLKTSFMVYMLGFLVAALALSSATASLFGGLQSRVTQDEREASGLFVYDADDGMLHPARSISLDDRGAELFVQVSYDGREPLDPHLLGASARIFDASSYPYEYQLIDTTDDENASDGTADNKTAGENGDVGDEDSANGAEDGAGNAEAPETGAFEVYLEGHDELEAYLNDDGTLPIDDLAAYDAQARALFTAWIAEHPESPLAAFEADDARDEEGSASGSDAPDGSDARDESGVATERAARDGSDAAAGSGAATEQDAPDGSPTAVGSDTRDGSETATAQDARDGSPAAAGSDAPGDRMPVSPVGYYLSSSPSPSAAALSALFGLLSFAMFPLWFGVCIFAAARRFFRTRLEPGLSTLDAAASKIADRDLDFHVEHDRDDELGHLASSFETMRASLAASQRALWRTAEERRRLNAAFAHDLRTPITVLKGKVELLGARLQAGDAAPEQLEASAAALARQVERLERYVEAMSGLQKLEDRAAVPERQTFDAVATGIDDIGRSLAAVAGKRFALSVSPTCDVARPPLRVDRAIVDEVAENLVGNALRFARTRADARLDVRDGVLVLTMDDDGPGFSANALEHGCAPFFSETPSESHFGLGLNIASLLCERHGGSLSLANRPEGGARVVARFAMNAPDECAGS